MEIDGAYSVLCEKIHKDPNININTEYVWTDTKRRLNDDTPGYSHFTYSDPRTPLGTQMPPSYAPEKTDFIFD